MDNAGTQNQQNSGNPAGIYSQQSTTASAPATSSSTGFFPHPRPDFKSAAPAGDIILTPNILKKKTKKPLIIVVVAVIVLMILAVLIITSIVPNSQKQQLKDIAIVLTTNEENFSKIDAIFIAASKEELLLDNTFTEDFYDGFQKSIEEYNNLYNQVYDLRIDGGDNKTTAARDAIEKIKVRNTYYGDTFNIYSNFYNAFVKDEDDARDALSKHSNPQVTALYKELNSIMNNIESIKQQGISAGCASITSSNHKICNELENNYLTASRSLAKNPIMNKIFTASEYYTDSIIPEKESEMYLLINEIRSSVDEN